MSYGINTSMKFKILNENSITKNDSKKKENYEQLEEYTLSNMCKKEGDSFTPSHNIRFHPLKPDTAKRLYNTKGKPIKFHENATIVKFNQQDLGEINSSQKQISFITLMGMFDETELEEINLEQILGISYEEMGILKDKLGKIMEYVKSAGGEGKNEALSVIKEKINQIDNNINNFDIIASELHNISKISYGVNETKVTFQMK